MTPVATLLNVPSGSGTPLGDLAKRGILRPSGTPGSGNGGMSLDHLCWRGEAHRSPLLPKEPLSSNHPK